MEEKGVLEMGITHTLSHHSQNTRPPAPPMKRSASLRETLLALSLLGGLLCLLLLPEGLSLL
jgi:hypothetical protein